MGRHVSLQRIAFTSHGLLQLLPGEHRVLVLEEAELHGQDCTIGPDGEDITGERGRLEATTQRLTWIEAGSRPGDPKRSCCLPIIALQSANMSTGMLTAIGIVPKVKVAVKVDRQSTPARTGTNVLKVSVTGSRAVIHKFQDSLSTLIERASKKPTDDLPSADASAIAQLAVMGYDRARANCALLCTGDDLSSTVQWLSEHSHQSIIDLKEIALRHVKEKNSKLTDVLTEQLKAMGYSVGAIQAARATTGSDNVAAIVEWLHTHPEAGNDHLSPATRYPEPQFGPQTNTSTISSHPVFGQASSSAGPAYPSAPTRPAYPVPVFPAPDMTSVHNPYALYTAGESYGSVQPAAPVVHAAPVPSTRPAGMEGLVAAQRAKASRIGADLKAGFQDLQALRESGEKLAQLAADLSARMAAGQNGDVMDAGMARELIELGIVSPVTKQSAGKQYHEQLSRQLAEFLEKNLQREKGMMVLHDVYCLFNRARGMELVSPDDLRTAAELFSGLKLPVRLRVFPSGVAVIQDHSWSDDAVCSAILDVLSKDDPSIADSNLGRGLSCTQYAMESSVPVAVATEQLLLAERKGFLCRDDGPSGLFFYRNWFVEV